MANLQTWFQSVVKASGLGTDASPYIVEIKETNSQAKASVATRSDVASLTTNVTILAANANRLGAIIYNDSSAILTIKFGTTASATDFTTKIAAGAEYSVPSRYTGRIDGLWATANGNARVTELTE